MDDNHRDRLYLLVGQKIKRIRKQRGKGSGQDWLASALGMSRTSVVNIEAGRQHPSLHVLWEIAELLEVPLTFLLPSPEEYTEYDQVLKLDEETISKIEAATVNNPLDRHYLTKFVASKSKRA